MRTSLPYFVTKMTSKMRNEQDIKRKTMTNDKCNSAVAFIMALNISVHRCGHYDLWVVLLLYVP